MQTIKFEEDDRTYEAIVAGCDYDIGITLVNKEDPDEYLLCCVGPLDPRVTKGEMVEWPEEEWRQLFEYVSTCIGKGVFSSKEFREKLLAIGAQRHLGWDPPTEETCPFNQ